MAFPSSSSASSSAPTSYPYYDVFINHRGPDVKNTLATHLYRRLLDHRLRVFLDKPELVEGRNITSQIEAAIQVASVHIAIFSPNYAQSKWCLDELHLMVKSKGTILPVFFNVKPSELRWTGKGKPGSYAEALSLAEQKKTVDSRTGEEKPRYDIETIQNWRNALSHAADISGFELDGDYEELLNKIVGSVLKNVPKTPLYVAKYPTGLEDKLQDFIKTVLLPQQEEGRVEAKVMGIVGVGGVGKTTLAKEFYNRKSSYYSGSSFLPDVRENAARRSLNLLQTQLISDLKHTDIKIESLDEGIGMLKRYLSSCNALIIVDDVDHASQLDAILPIKEILHPSSLILVTSRDKHVLRNAGILEPSMYKLEGLNRQYSQELFCSYAFCQPHPLPEFVDLVVRYINACDGLPLSLKVFGALVCGENDARYWEEQLDRLQHTLPDEIHKKLKISYDSLSKEDQPIFLDIACFFIGEDRDMAISIWGLVGLKNMENKCLLEVDIENKIKMHDHVRDLGRNIAEEDSMPRRLWQKTTNNSNIDDLLERSSCAITQVRGIKMVSTFDMRHSLGLGMRANMSRYKIWMDEVFRNGVGYSLARMHRRESRPPHGVCLRRLSPFPSPFAGISFGDCGRHYVLDVDLDHSKQSTPGCERRPRAVTLLWLSYGKKADVKPLHIRGAIIIQPFFGGEICSKWECETSDPSLTRKWINVFWKLSLPVGANRDHFACNPIILSKLKDVLLPPVLLCISERDVLRERNLEYFEALKKAGQNVRHVIFKDVGHAFQVLQPQSPRIQELIKTINDFINGY